MDVEPQTIAEFLTCTYSYSISHRSREDRYVAGCAAVELLLVVQEDPRQADLGAYHPQQHQLCVHAAHDVE